VKPADEAAFRDFVTARSAGLLRTAYLLTGDRGLAEDAVLTADVP
jgi:DNA-directed RNA polymerase specialized sigma24 family protein